MDQSEREVFAVKSAIWQRAFAAYPLICRFLVFIALPLLVGAIVVFAHLRGSLPENDTVKTSVRERVRISRDGSGVVFIHAANNMDAYFALGFAQAQDRLWQLEVQRRIAQGRLSEIFGSRSVRQDSWMR